MEITGILSALIVGLVIGVLGKLVMPGRQKTPIWLTILVGIVAAFVGTAIARGLGVANTEGIDWIEVLIQIALAAAGIGIVAGTRKHKSIL
ncbi:GlsB/YeaQ/YmgE family stress response membrane protein [Lentzea nigeriaca]|uniref:GlsB/YeaQ/YmgE family stress response membrane protein n=1 Tax=Lentzea nigeriaca TaxID=1128665 RepID=UPI00195D17A1|nr:GlsB/YeaQ/YmgE family stress response membrane protein [Lentzea nigeriaca]MBM7864287.1 putative membrane protein YeaQ/YmgE (transglycosylase-associated protein family) [Lentzea nigeriaca]